MKQSNQKRGRLRPIHLLLVLPFFAMLSVGFYNRVQPTLVGIPFFYWFQLLWIALGAALIWPVYRAEERDRDGRAK